MQVSLKKTLGVSLLVSAQLFSGAVPLSPGLSPRMATAEDASSAASFNDTLPAAFNSGAAESQLASIFTSCQGQQLNNLIGSAGTALTSGAGMGAPVSVGMDTACPAAGEVEVPTECSAVKSGSSVNPTVVRRLKESIQAQLSALICQKGKFQAIQGELTCLQGQAQLLSQRIASLQQAYVGNITKFQQDVAQMKQAIDERGAQEQETLSLLNGDQGTGRKGLLQAQQAIQQVLPRMNQEIDEAKTAFSDLTRQQQALKEQTETRKIAATGNCFKTQTNPAWSCQSRGAASGPPPTAYDYVLCRVRQMAQVNESGEVDTRQAAQNNSSRRESEIRAVLDSMLREAPSQANMPTNPQEAAASGSQSLTILSVADMNSRYGSQLAGFNSHGLDIRGFVMSVMGSCYQQAEQDITREQARANTTSGTAEFRMQQSERQLRSTSAERLRLYGQAYTDGIRALTGMNLPVNTSGCASKSTEVMISCMEDAQRNLQGLSAGTLKNSEMQMVVRGRSPATTIPIRCRGIDGCVTELQNVKTFVTKEKERVTGLKQSYVQRANSEVERFSTTMRGALQGQAGFLTQRLQQLNSSLASLGVGGGIQADPLEAEELEKDEDGLVKSPKNVLAHIGGGMSPPMLNVSGNSFSEALKGLADGVKDVDQNLARARGGPDRVDALAQRCAQEDIEKLVESAGSDADSLAGCDSVNRCGNPAGVDRLMNDIGSITGVDSSALDSLNTGLSSNCNGTGASSSGDGPCAGMSKKSPSGGAQSPYAACITARAQAAASSNSASTATRCRQTVSRLERKVRQITAAQRNAEGIGADAAR